MENSMINRGLAVLFALWLAIPCIADELDYSKFDKDVLVKVAENQQKEIDRLNAKILELEAQIARLSKELESRPTAKVEDGGEPPEANDDAKTVNGFGEIFKNAPEGITPKKGESWDTYKAGFERWLKEDVPGIKIETRKKRGETFAISNMSWNGASGTAYLVIAKQPQNSSWTKMMIELPEGGNLEIFQIALTISDAAIYRQLERERNSQTTYSINGRIKGTGLLVFGREDIDLQVFLDPSTKLIDAIMPWKESKSTPSAAQIP